MATGKSDNLGGVCGYLLVIAVVWLFIHGGFWGNLGWLFLIVLVLTVLVAATKGIIYRFVKVKTPSPVVTPVTEDCPICGHPNVVGTTVCAACGETIKVTLNAHTVNIAIKIRKSLALAWDYWKTIYHRKNLTIATLITVIAVLAILFHRIPYLTAYGMITVVALILVMWLVSRMIPELLVIIWKTVGWIIHQSLLLIRGILRNIFWLTRRLENLCFFVFGLFLLPLIYQLFFILPPVDSRPPIHPWLSAIEPIIRQCIYTIQQIEGTALQILCILACISIAVVFRKLHNMVGVYLGAHIKHTPSWTPLGILQSLSMLLMDAVLANFFAWWSKQFLPTLRRWLWDYWTIPVNRWTGIKHFGAVLTALAIIVGLYYGGNLNATQWNDEERGLRIGNFAKVEFNTLPAEMWRDDRAKITVITVNIPALNIDKHWEPSKPHATSESGAQIEDNNDDETAPTVTSNPLVEPPIITEPLLPWPDFIEVLDFPPGLIGKSVRGGMPNDSPIKQQPMSYEDELAARIKTICVVKNYRFDYGQKATLKLRLMRKGLVFDCTTELPNPSRDKLDSLCGDIATDFRKTPLPVEPKISTSLVTDFLVSLTFQDSPQIKVTRLPENDNRQPGVFIFGPQGSVQGGNADGEIPRKPESGGNERVVRPHQGTSSSGTHSTDSFFELVKTESLSEIMNAINKGAKVEVKDNDGKLPLHYAAKNNPYPEVIAALIKKNGDVNEKDNRGKTPLHYAAESNNLEVISALIKAKAKVDAQDKEGKMPLHIAIEHNQKLEIIAELIKADKKRVNRKISDGSMPLHLAAKHNHTPGVVAALLEAGADVNAKDKAGRTSLKLAIDNNNDYAIHALRKAGAK